MTLAGLPIAAWMFPALFTLVFLGVPVSYSLIGIALAFGWLIFDWNIGLQLHGRLVEVASNFVLSAIPLFVFMGAMLERSGIAARLFEATRLMLGRLPGGLALAAIAMCAVFAASSGVVGAVEIVVGLMAVPAMLKANYPKPLAAGTICAGGSLGTVIPPSIVVVIYASITEMSVGDLFAGIVIPGFIMVALFMAWVLVACLVDPPPPGDGEADAAFARLTRSQKLALIASALAPSLMLIVLVLGSIFAGIASPTEAAAVGAAGATALTLAYGRFTWAALVEALERTVKTTAMIMLIIAGGVMFSAVFIVGGGNQMVRGLVSAAEIDGWLLVALVLSIIFVLGFVLDWISVVLVAVPILDPIVRAAGFDPIWFAILVCITLQTSYLTPPMAPSIFFLRAIAPPEMTYGHMMRGVVPFVILQLITLAIVALIPATATWLPGLLFRGF